MHRAGHILDWVISRSDIPAFLHSMSVEDLLLSDHFLVRLKTNMKRPVAGRKKIKTRNLKNIDMYSFRESLAKSDLVKSQSSAPEKLVLLYNQTLSTLLDDNSPMTEKLVSDRPDTSWFTPSVRKTKLARRIAEKRWRQSGLEEHKQAYKRARNRFAQEIRHAKSQHVQSVLKAADTDSRKMFSVVNDLLGKKSASPTLPDKTRETAAETMSIFFNDRIETIRKSFRDCNSLPADENLFEGNLMTELIQVDEIQLRRYIAARNLRFAVRTPSPQGLCWIVLIYCFLYC